MGPPSSEASPQTYEPPGATWLLPLREWVPPLIRDGSPLYAAVTTLTVQSQSTGLVSTSVLDHAMGMSAGA